MRGVDDHKEAVTGARGEAPSPRNRADVRVGLSRSLGHLCVSEAGDALSKTPQAQGRLALWPRPAQPHCTRGPRTSRALLARGARHTARRRPSSPQAEQMLPSPSQSPLAVTSCILPGQAREKLPPLLPRRRSQQPTLWARGCPSSGPRPICPHLPSLQTLWLEDGSKGQ